MIIHAYTTSFPSAGMPDAGIFVARLFNALGETHTVQVFHPQAASAADHPENSTQNTVQCGKATDTGIAFAPRAVRQALLGPGGIPAAIARAPWLIFVVVWMLCALGLHALVHSRKTQVVMANWALVGLICACGAYIWRKPLVTILRGEDIRRAQSSRVARVILRAALALSTYTVAVSSSLKEAIETLLGPQSRLRVIENGVEPSLLAIPPRTWDAHTPLRILAIGSVIPRKDYPTLLQALALAPHCTLTVVGGGVLIPALRAQCQALGITARVTFAGAVPPAHIPQYLREHHLYASASLFEGRQNALIEAFASNMPVLVSNIPPNVELLQEGVHGYSFPVGDVAALAVHLNAYAQHPTRIATQSQAVQILAQQHICSWPQTAAHYTALLNEVTKNHALNAK